MSRLTNGLAVLRREGPYAVAARVVRRVFPYTPTTPQMVDYDDAISIDWRTVHPAVANLLRVNEGPLTVAWIMSPPGPNSGGHQNLFRFIKVLELAGHRVNIYLWSAFDTTSVGEVRELLAHSDSYSNVAATVERYPASGVAPATDAIFATSWETAYRSYRDPSAARRFYFVQDFEPLFYQTGSQTVLAENTYRFGFRAITAGGWLASRLHDDYGMTTAHFDFGTEPRHYSYVNGAERRGIFFYARPETPRRGFELGAMALDLFAQDRPGFNVVLAGQALGRLDLRFPHRVLGNLQPEDLNAVYNDCAAGLVLSLTNMSLLPLELLAAGAIPVVNDAANNRLVSNNPYIAFAQPNPRALADALIEITDRQDASRYAEKAAASTLGNTWEAAGRQFLAAFEDGMRD